MRMAFLSVKQFAQKHNISERTIRNYCATGKIDGAFLVGKTWNIPENASLPSSLGKRKNTLLSLLCEQMNMK